MSLAPALLAIFCAGGGVGLLHLAWTRRGGAGLVLGGWLLLVIALAPWRASGAAWDKSAAFGLITPILIALGGLVLKTCLYQPRARSRVVRGAPPTEPPAASGSIWRSVSRTVLAGPLAGLAAVGLAALVALKTPWAMSDRLVLSLFVLPLAWSIAGVWASMDPRLGRVCAVLIIVCVVGFGAARL